MRKYIKKIKDPYEGFLYGMVLGLILCILNIFIMAVISLLPYPPNFHISPYTFFLGIFLPSCLCCAILPTITCTFIGNHNQSTNRVKRQLPIEDSRPLITNSQKQPDDKEGAVAITTSDETTPTITPQVQEDFPYYAGKKPPDPGIELITFFNPS